MKIGDAFPSNYLKASDLGEAQPVVTIERVEMEAIGRNKERKAVVYFKGKAKGLVLNKTNATRISQLVGSDDTDDWANKPIRIYATETEFGGETVECIRVKAAKATKPDKPEPKSKPEPELESEFDEDPVPF